MHWFFGQVFAALLMMVAATASDGAGTAATLTVPGSALVFAGAGLLPPDSEGHFAIGITLPQPGIRADRCESADLIVGLGTLNKPEADLTDADRRVIAHNVRFYNDLVARAKQGDRITLPVRNDPLYLRVSNGTVIAPYCTLSIDERRLP